MDGTEQPRRQIRPNMSCWKENKSAVKLDIKGMKGQGANWPQRKPKIQ
jgi:hypothetical protein